MRTLKYFLMIAVMLLGLVAAYAQSYEYVEYTIIKGDTLWDITGIQLKDSFQWPMVWKENPGITNPDMIYPGRVIRIPKDWIMQPETGLEIKAPAPAQPGEMTPPPTEEHAMPAPGSEPSYLTPQQISVIASRELVLSSGYITRNPPNVGSIDGNPLHRTIFAHGDEIYITTRQHSTVGQKYYVIRNEAAVKHPNKTFFPGMGYLVRVIGIVQVDEDGNKTIKAHVVEAFADITTDDVLENFYEVESAYIAGSPRKPDINATIVASTKMKTLNGWTDIVFIDKGEAEGVRLGDIYLVLLKDARERKAALIQVIGMQKNTSLCTVIETYMDIGPGSIVRGVQSLKGLYPMESSKF
jgi:hypothetical protein